MKRVRKIFAAFAIITALSLLLGLSAYATGENLGTEDASENAASENEDIGETAAESENSALSEPTLWDRISEYLTGDKLSEALTLAYNVFCTVLLILMRRSTKTSTADLLKIVTASNKSSKEKMNELAEVYNANEKEVEELKEEIRMLREEHKIQTVTAEQFTAALEGIRSIGNVLQTIYQNSSTIPAVIKTEVAKSVVGLNDGIDAAEAELGREVS